MCGEVQEPIAILVGHLPFTAFMLNLLFQHSALIQQGCVFYALKFPPPYSRCWPVTSFPANTAKQSAMSLGITQPPTPLTHIAAENTDTNTHTQPSPPFDLMFYSPFSARLQINLNVLRRNVRQSEGLWSQCRDKKLRIWPVSNTGPSLTSLPPLFTPSLLHQLIQAWSDTWASRVSVAIKMLPLQNFNWNFCCWCVNSCRTEKGRSIIPSIHRLLEVKWQQLPWQENPLSSCLFMILLLHP